MYTIEPIGCKYLKGVETMMNKDTMQFLLGQNSRQHNCNNQDGFSFFIEMFGCRFLMDSKEQMEYFAETYASAGAMGFSDNTKTYSVRGDSNTLKDALSINRS